jgi:hypothetical protein
MPFVIRYKMLVGTSERAADTPAEAIAAYRELREAGAGAIAIFDQDGRLVQLDEISIAATPLPKAGWVSSLTQLSARFRRPR